MTPAHQKSTVDQIRQRFDADVERFSNLETGQSATIDAPLAMSLVAETAAAVTPRARHVLDVGCGAGNYTLKLLQHLPNLDVTLLDLSRPMLDRAVERIGQATTGTITPLQSDVRDVSLPDGSVDVILAAAVLHHLRTDGQWAVVFSAFHCWLRPGGSVWIFDMVESELAPVHAVMWRRYADYLDAFKGPAYCQHVFAYIDQEDSPRSLVFQLDRLRQAGFGAAEVLHKNGPFAAFGAVKQLA